MLDSIKSFFSKNLEPSAEGRSDDAAAPPDHDPITVAACALLLELAYADDEFTDDEREHIESAMAHHFQLPAETVSEVIALAEEERRRSVDLYQFTRLISDRYDLGQKMVLAELVHRDPRGNRVYQDLPELMNSNYRWTVTPWQLVEETVWTSPQ